MRKRVLRTGALLALALLSPAALAADELIERSINTRANLPDPVRDELRRRFPRGEVLTAARVDDPLAGEVWEVELTEGLQSRQVAVDPAGLMLGEREPIATAAVPPEARDALERRFGRASIWHAEHLRVGDVEGWALTFSRRDRHGTALVRDDGRLVGASVTKG